VDSTPYMGHNDTLFYRESTAYNVPSVYLATKALGLVSLSIDGHYIRGLCMAVYYLYVAVSLPGTL
jgi:hypothetical protein